MIPRGVLVTAKKGSGPYLIHVFIIRPQSFVGKDRDLGHKRQAFYNIRRFLAKVLTAAPKRCKVIFDKWIPIFRAGCKSLPVVQPTSRKA